MAMLESLQDMGKTSELAWSSGAAPWSVLIVGLPRNSMTEQGLGELAGSALAAFEIVPDARERALATFARVFPLPGAFDCAVVGFSSESVAELFLDSWPQLQVPRGIDKTKLTLVRNFRSSKRIDSRDDMLQELVSSSSSPTFEARFVVYVSGLADEWVDQARLQDYFAKIVKEYQAEEVVKSVHVSQQLKDAYVVLTNDIAADLVFYRSKRDGLLGRISKEAFICRGANAIPLLQQMPPRIDEAVAKPLPSEIETPPPLPTEKIEVTPPPPCSPEKIDATQTTPRAPSSAKKGGGSEKKATFMDFLKPRPTGGGGGGGGKTPDLNVPPLPAEAPPLKAEPDVGHQSTSPPARVHRFAARRSDSNNESKERAMSSSENEDSASVDSIPRGYGHRYAGDKSTAIFVTNMQGHDPERLQEVILILLRRKMPRASIDSISVRWTLGRHFAHVELRSARATHLVMEAYVEHTHDAFFPSFPVEIYRHFKYYRPGTDRGSSLSAEGDESGPVIIHGLPKDLHLGLVRGALTELLESALARLRRCNCNMGRQFFSSFSYDDEAGVARVRFGSRAAFEYLRSIKHHRLELAGGRITLEKDGDWYEDQETGDTTWKRKKPYGADYGHDYGHAKQARHSFQ